MAGNVAAGGPALRDTPALRELAPFKWSGLTSAATIIRKRQERSFLFTHYNKATKLFS